MPQSHAPQPAPEVMRESSENTPNESSLDNSLNRTDGTTADHQTIAKIAFSLWQERGSPYGSPEEDWYLAEKLANDNRAEEVVH